MRGTAPLRALMAAVSCRPGRPTRPVHPVHRGRPAAIAAALRIATGLYAAVQHGRRRRMLRDLHRQDSARFVPVGPVRILRRPLPPWLADALFDVAQLTNVAVTLGLFLRITGPLNAALQLWTLSYRNSWGMIYHNDNNLVLHQAVVGLSPPVGDRFSVDAALGAAAGRQRARAAYELVPLTMNVVTVAIYFISGIAKLRGPLGWRWASGRALREQIAADAVRKEQFGASAPRLAGTMFHSKTLGVLATGSLVVELGAPLALLDRRLGAIFSVAAWGMHVGIRLVMGIKFPYNTSGIVYLPMLAGLLRR